MARGGMLHRRKGGWTPLNIGVIIRSHCHPLMCDPVTSGGPCAIKQGNKTRLPLAALAPLSKGKDPVTSGGPCAIKQGNKTRLPLAALAPLSKGT